MLELSEKKAKSNYFIKWKDKMSEFNIIGKTLLFFGVVLIILGGIFLLVGKLPFSGRLPGDIVVQRKNFIFYFPLGLCILISIILTIIFRIFRH